MWGANVRKASRHPGHQPREEQADQGKRNEIDFNEFDLNLLRVFDLVMREGNLTQAGKKLGRTPPAMSQLLSRLREIMGDPLFKSSGRSMVPTQRAKEIAPQVQAGLDLLRVTLTQERSFEPKTSNRTFIIDMPVGADSFLTPQLASYAAVHAPGVRFIISSDRAGELLNELRTGETELAIDHEKLAGPDMRHSLLYADPFVVISRKNHPAIAAAGGKLTLDLYNKAEHVAVTWTRGQGDSPMDVRLRQVGVNRNCRVLVPTISSLPAVVEATDLLAAMSLRVARRIQRHWDIDIHEAPYAIEAVALHLVWHERFDNDPGHIWLRNVFATVGAEI